MTFDRFVRKYFPDNVDHQDIATACNEPKLHVMFWDQLNVVPDDVVDYCDAGLHFWPLMMRRLDEAEWLRGR